MYRQQHKKYSSTFTVNEGYKGETIEQKVTRITVNKEPIKDGAPLIYTERKDGVQPGYDIRTDRWEVAAEAMDKVTGAKLAKREERMKGTDQKTETKTEAKSENIGGAESTQG